VPAVTAPAPAPTPASAPVANTSGSDNNDWNCFCEGSAHWAPDAQLVQECVDANDDTLEDTSTEAACSAANQTWTSYGCTDVMDHLAEAYSLSCANTTLLDDVMLMVKLTCCGLANTSVAVQPEQNVTTVVERDANGTAPHWGACVCPKPSESLLPTSSFYLCEDEDQTLLSLPPDECDAPNTLSKLPCQGTLDQLWSEYDFTCADWSNFPPNVRDAVQQGCCSGAAPLPAAPAAPSEVKPAESPYVTERRPCEGGCTPRFDRCFGQDMPILRPCCEPGAICVVRNQYHSQVRHCVRWWSHANVGRMIAQSTDDVIATPPCARNSVLPLACLSGVWCKQMSAA
jgi:hypothetical protein